MYQDLAALKQSVTRLRADLTEFDASCFDGAYVTGDIDDAYLDHLEGRHDRPRNEDDGEGRASHQMVLGLANGGQE